MEYHIFRSCKVAAFVKKVEFVPQKQTNNKTTMLLRQNLHLLLLLNTLKKINVKKVAEC